jgi:ABC-type glycerol-3-phosphate transport system permease component
MSWNDFPYALILTGGNAKTLPVFISGYWTFRGIQMGEMSVAVLVAIIPVLICIFFIQKHIVKGLTAGAVKF